MTEKDGENDYKTSNKRAKNIYWDAIRYVSRNGVNEKFLPSFIKWKNDCVRQLEQENKELRTRVAEQEKLIEWHKTDTHDVMEWKNEFQNRLSTLEAEARNLAGGITDKDDKILSLLKASEGLEKALEAIAGRDVSIPDYDWCDWNGLDATHETSKIIAEFAKQALADFRAVKETMEKGASK